MQTNKNNRFLAIILAVCMLVSVFTISASAVDTAGAVIEGATVTVDPGETVTMEATLTNNPGILGMTLKVTYDEDLTLTGAANGDALSVLSMTKPGKFVSPCNFLWDGQEVTADDIKDGVLFTLTFVVPDDAQIGDHFDVAFEVVDATDNDLNPVAVTTIGGCIEIVDSHVHTMKHTEAVPATCEADGNSEYWTCTECGKYFSDEAGTKAIEKDSWIIKALGHDWSEWTVTKEATELEAGEESRECSRCHQKETNVIPATGKHTLEHVEAVDPKCEEEGNIEYWVCTGCGKYYSDEEATTEIDKEDTVVAALGHDWSEWEEVKAPTEYDDGEESRECGRCGEKESRAIPPLGHTHTLEKTEAVEATCEEAGNIEYWTCTGCGRLYTDENGTKEIDKNKVVIAALGHDWSEWKETKAATDTEEGEETRTCARCGKVETRSIAKTNPVTPWIPYENTNKNPSKPSTPVTPVTPVNPTPTEDPTPKNPFFDVKAGDYFYDAVLWAVDQNITAGMTPNAFEPNSLCTRGQIVTFLWRAAGSPEPAGTDNPFTDVKASDYFYKAVLWAVEKGITAGLTPTTFGPNEVCSRAQAVTFLWRYFGSPKPTTSNNPFTDVNPDDYYYDAVLWAVEKGITAGVTPTTFGPTQSCTRAQIVSFLYRALAKKD